MAVAKLELVKPSAAENTVLFFRGQENLSKTVYKDYTPIWDMRDEFHSNQQLYLLVPCKHIFPV